MTCTTRKAPNTVQLEAGENVYCEDGRYVAKTATPWLRLRFADCLPAGRWISLAYKMSMRDARSYFYARQFPMQNKDILYVSAAPLNEVQKILTMIGTVTGVVSSGAVVRSTIRN